MTTRPDGWSFNEATKTWAPPAQGATQKQWEVPPDVGLTTIRDKAIEVRNAEAEVVVRMGKLSDGTYGLQLLSGALVISQLSGSTLDVRDAEGDLRVRIGKDGTDYDVKVYEEDGTNPVKLSTLAFGKTAESDNGLGTRNTAAYEDLTGADAGPAVTVDIGPTGTALVWFGARINIQDDEGGSVGVAISGATTEAAPAGGDFFSAPVAYLDATDNGAGAFSIGASVGTAVLFSGLNEGSTTFTLKYQSALAGATVSFDNRYIVVVPY
jgi:hypothetical protein